MDKNHIHIVILIDTEKACDKIQCTFMIRGKKAMSLGIEGDFHHMIKDIYEKPKANIIFSED